MPPWIGTFKGAASHGCAFYFFRHNQYSKENGTPETGVPL
jgi:hypothetical protein